MICTHIQKKFPITAMREIKLLQKLKHDRIVELQEIMVAKGSVYMVLEYMDHDLSGILGHPNFNFEPAHAKSLVKQMLEGLAYLHHMGILHRDIKGKYFFYIHIKSIWPNPILQVLIC